VSAAELPEDQLVEVVLRGFPVALHERADEHHRELLREFTHIAHADSSEGSDRVPERLVALVAAVRAEYAPIGGDARARIERARAEAESAIELRYVVPAGMLDVIRRLVFELEEADEFCRSGDLLTLATPDDIVTFRRWFLGEFERQLLGELPVAWPDYRG
jgi:hypothetical protein